MKQFHAAILVSSLPCAATCHASNPVILEGFDGASQAQTLPDVHLRDRIGTYNKLSQKLSSLSNQDLSTMLEKANPLHKGTGGTSVSIEIEGTQVFVKKVRLTDLERQPNNKMSTANVFQLPLFYQYGVGSAGFGVWRELEAHKMANEWILNGECANFPLMYHWRELPCEPQELVAGDMEQVERRITNWENSPAIRARLEANQKASAYVALFLENIPQTVESWLLKKLDEDYQTFESAIRMVDSNLKAITSFINSRGLLHFDAHFRNILTDGNRLYLADFGLATSTKFNLAESEAEFFKGHHIYDRCYTIGFLANWIVDPTFKDSEQADLKLISYSAGQVPEARTPWIANLLTHYAPIAVLMNDFMKKLCHVSKSTPYPLTELKAALMDLERKKL